VSSSFPGFASNLSSSLLDAETTPLGGWDTPAALALAQHTLTNVNGTAIGELTVPTLMFNSSQVRLEIAF
jgi:hypothetical protein